jgi:hypothetical protein
MGLFSAATDCAIAADEQSRAAADARKIWVNLIFIIFLI